MLGTVHHLNQYGQLLLQEGHWPFVMSSPPLQASEALNFCRKCLLYSLFTLCTYYPVSILLFLWKCPASQLDNIVDIDFRLQEIGLSFLSSQATSIAEKEFYNLGGSYFLLELDPRSGTGDMLFNALSDAGILISVWYFTVN